jgi:hypothetical protein
MGNAVISMFYGQHTAANIKVILVSFHFDPFSLIGPFSPGTNVDELNKQIRTLFTVTYLYQYHSYMFWWSSHHHHGAPWKRVGVILI